MRSPLAVAAFVVAASLSGCLDLFGRGFADHDVARSPIDLVGWNTDGVFSVQVRDAEAVEVRIEAVAGSQVVSKTGLSNATLPAVELQVPDGTWAIRYFLDGKKWESFKPARFDSTAPSLAGLQLLGTATGGQYTFGSGVQLEAGTTVRIIDQDTAATVATALPATVGGLADGIHAYDVVATDAAGNQAVEQVQVRAGSATQLPDGTHTLGLVARYNLDVQLWDISGLADWVTPATARSAAGNAWLGAGHGITPSEPAVQDVVADEVTPGMTTGEAAFALFKWMAANLDYDKSRLDTSTLLTPRQTILDTEAPGDTDTDKDGLSASGAGNGVRGGVCRDLAGLYVSLLRAAGIPARLVTGYVGGEVDGFHAWVEFYGGPGHGASPWVPVDVSPITGPYEPETALQAFGIRHTDMMPLRVVTETQEQGRWSTAVSLSTQFPAGSEPTVEPAKDAVTEFDAKGVLCVDPASLRRATINSPDGNDCPASYALFLPDFSVRATHLLDYGADVVQAAGGTTVTLIVAYPEAAAVAPGTVEQQTYGASFTPDGEGLKQGVWTKTK